MIEALFNTEGRKVAVLAIELEVSSIAAISAGDLINESQRHPIRLRVLDDLDRVVLDRGQLREESVRLGNVLVSSQLGLDRWIV